jgi:hypothetical protein
MLATSAYAVLYSQPREELPQMQRYFPNKQISSYKLRSHQKNVIFKSTKDVAKIGPFRKPICLI